ncbi:MAG: SpoIIE family protein phosphatase, partial [Planctomycetes bacterium]|nr:SpoIIE family protein phosphatase [Planctomycetota bacterium]
PQTFQTNGDVLGAFDDVTFEPAGRTVAKGDRFFIYSDGLIETTGQSPDDRAEGIRRLSQACYDKGDLPITSAVETVCSELLADLAGDRDDVVLLGVEV